MKHTTTRNGNARMNPPRPHGFTLVELLVVITIIVILAAVVVVMTGKIKAKAYQVNAISSLRQVAAYSAAYSAENNGDINMLRYPSTAKEGTPSWIKNTFWGRLQPYMFPEISTSEAALQKDIKKRLDGLFKTDTAAGSASDPKGIPMQGTVVSGSRMYRDSSGLAIPFGFNTNLLTYSTTAPFTKISSFSDPSQVIYATYGFGLFSETDGQTYVKRPTTNTKPSNNIYYLDDGKALCAFLDGHIESLSPPIPARKFR
jgi:prepilin-type N-terminal cleavage/methylation domain-containing protein